MLLRCVVSFALVLVPAALGEQVEGRWALALGGGVTDRAVGDRVAIAWLGSACGECQHCIGGWETLCESQQNSGYSVDGTFAEYAVVAAAFATPVPDAVSSQDAAPLTCAGVTTYKAIKVARVAPAELVAVFGVGGLLYLDQQIGLGTVVAAVLYLRQLSAPIDTVLIWVETLQSSVASSARASATTGIGSSPLAVPAFRAWRWAWMRSCASARKPWKCTRRFGSGAASWKRSISMVFPRPTEPQM